MIIYRIWNSCNVISFLNSVFGNWNILEIIEILQIANSWNFQNGNFSNSPNWTFFEFSKWNFFNSPNCRFLGFSKLKIFRIFQIWSFWNCSNWKIKKFQDIFQFGKWKFGSKNWQYGIVRPFDIPHYSQFCQFSYLPFDINQFRRLNFSTFISYSSGNFLDWQFHKIINFLKFNFEN